MKSAGKRAIPKKESFQSREFLSFVSDPRGAGVLGMKESGIFLTMNSERYFFLNDLRSHAVENQIEDREDHSAHTDAGIGEDWVCQLQRIQQRLHQRRGKSGMN